MDSATLQSLLDAVRPLALEAGAAIREVARGDVDTTEKEDGSPLTRADTASHRVIQSGLSKLQPALPVLSEEGDLEDAGIGAWRQFWCVDPLDGTKEFVKGLDEYTVNIALIDDDRPILGVVYVPVQNVTYFAAAGLGAWKAPAGDAEPVQIAASAAERPATAVVSRSHLSDETKEFLERLGVGDMVQHGSSIKICAVAEGRADIYPRHGPTCLWDTAAGAAVALEAGCRVVDLNGRPLSYRPAEGIKRPGFVVYPSAMARAVAAAMAPQRSQ